METNSWEQLKAEKDDEYQYFVKFLNQEVRNLFQLSQDLNLPLKKLQTLHKLNNWEKRTADFDNNQTKLFFKKREEIINNLASDVTLEELKVKKLNTSLMQEVLIKMLIREKETVTTDVKIAELDKLNNIGKREIVQNITSESSDDFSSLNNEELIQLENLLKKAKKV